MPRQIIDTETSRPAYQRRLLVRWILAAIVLLALTLLGFEWMKAHRTPSVNLAPVPHSRSFYAA
ncbi:MAG: hypothetical protein KGN02_10915 [bacterium]|nr:hypothetical protein [bacterium]